MKGLPSLSARLLLGAALWTGGLLLLAAVVSRERLRTHLEERQREFLALQLDELAAGIGLDGSGSPALERALGDRRFANATSGLSWEVRDAVRTVLASPAAARNARLSPNESIEVRRSITTPAALQLVARADRSVVEDGELFLNPVAATTALALAALLLATGALVTQRSLGTFARLRERLAAVRGGAARRLEGAYPSEIQPLVDDLNGLLQHNENAITRAAQQAGNLAHALKTPLAVIANEAFQLSSTSDGSAGRALASQVRLMEERVSMYLARARTVASGQRLGARCDVQQTVEGVVRVMRRLHAERGLEVDVSVGPAAFRGEQHDLEEMLGNLIDNACKWGRRRVAIAGSVHGDFVELTVDNDGPGLSRDQPVSGYGLTIVQDLVQTYGGALQLSPAPLGGVRATLRLPAALT